MSHTSETIHRELAGIAVAIDTAVRNIGLAVTEADFQKPEPLQNLLNQMTESKNAILTFAGGTTGDQDLFDKVMTELTAESHGNYVMDSYGDYAITKDEHRERYPEEYGEWPQTYSSEAEPPSAGSW